MGYNKYLEEDIFLVESGIKTVYKNLDKFSGNESLIIDSMVEAMQRLIQQARERDDDG